MVAVLPLLGALIGGLQFFDTMLRATSAPQQAAGMAMACAWAILPYVFARSVEMLRGSTASRPKETDAHGDPQPGPPLPYIPPVDGASRVPIWVIGGVVLLVFVLGVSMILNTPRNSRLDEAKRLDAIDRAERESAAPPR